MPKDTFYIKYKLPEDVRDWRYDWAKKDIKEHHLSMDFVKTINYRPFDVRYVYYTGRSRGFMGWPVVKIMQHFLKGENVGLVTGRQCADDWKYIFISKLIGQFNLTGTAGRYGSGNYFPLYLYPKDTSQQTIIGNQTRTPNLNKKIVQQITDKLNLTFTPEKETTPDTFAPIDLLDYIYAVLHSPTYREKYKESLKRDFPRVPYPEDKKAFWQLVALGGELRQLHLLESPKVEQSITSYPEGGDNRITRRITIKDWELYDIENKLGKVLINDKQYFDKVPLVAWEFYIGGYQPAQKWLKDRHGRILTPDDIFHYRKIIVALKETDRIMKEIDVVWRP